MLEEKLGLYLKTLIGYHVIEKCFTSTAIKYLVTWYTGGDFRRFLVVLILAGGYGPFFLAPLRTLYFFIFIPMIYPYAKM